MFLDKSASWKQIYPTAAVGVLVIHDVCNPEFNQALEDQKTLLESLLRQQFSGSDRSAIEALETIQAYNAYLKPFKKTYHVLLQLESVVFKDKSIPHVAALVEAMFMAELQSQLLTAGHDLDSLNHPVRIEAANGSETFRMMNGKEQVIKTNDMIISDRTGIISSIVYGPDLRTRITATTRNVLYTTYAPPGISHPALISHMQNIQDYVHLISPQCVTQVCEIVN
jgi:DNA/RNA-binding domain of Phe-tRNA-synthetase-like protein